MHLSTFNAVTLVARRYEGIGSLRVESGHGEVKANHGDFVVELTGDERVVLSPAAVAALGLVCVEDLMDDGVVNDSAKDSPVLGVTEGDPLPSGTNRTSPSSTSQGQRSSGSAESTGEAGQTGQKGSTDDPNDLNQFDK